MLLVKKQTSMQMLEKHTSCFESGTKRPFLLYAISKHERLCLPTFSKTGEVENTMPSGVFLTSFELAVGCN